MNTFDTEESEWGLINMGTGDITPIDKLDGSQDQWHRVYGRALANMLEVGGESKSRVIACLIRARDFKNMIHMTQSEIAEKAKVSTKTVTRTLKELENANFIHRVRNGRLMFSPHVIRTGRNSMGLAVITMWDKERDQ